MNQKLKAKIIEMFGSQADFAVAAEEHESLVSRVIRNRVRLSDRKAEKWASILKCDEETFLGK